MNEDLLRAELTRDEGKRLALYKDSKGIWSIGIGRNLQDRGISEDECALLFSNDVRRHVNLLDKYLPWWRQLDEVRQRVVANLAFNLGVGPTEDDPRGKLLTFKNTLDLVHTGDYETAAKHLETSLWAGQVGQRAARLIAALRTGVMP